MSTQVPARRGPVEVEVDIDGLNPDGLGLAQHGQQRLQVRNALPGETLAVRILKKRKGVRFAECADADGIVAPHADRRRSACPHFPRCGGCNLHHLDYAAQLTLKQAQLRQALQAQGVAAQAWNAPQSSGRLGYRRKARLGVRLLGDHVLVGFRESFSNRVAKLQACLALTPRLSQLLVPLRELLVDLSISDRIPQIEVAQGDAGVALIVRHLAPLSGADHMAWQQFALRHDVQVLLQAGNYDTLQPLQGGAVQPLGYSLPEWGLYLQFLPQQFTQVNLDMNRMLIRQALAYLGDLRGRRVLDLFCGIGNFSLPLARAGAQVTGIEVASDAVEMARRNALLNGCKARNEFAVADLYRSDEAEGLVTGEFDVLVLDPPRSGAGPGLPQWLRAFRGDDVVYVSCQPASFAADAAVLVQHGFALREVGVYDMFPHTAHVETMGHFVRTARGSS